MVIPEILLLFLGTFFNINYSIEYRKKEKQGTYFYLK